MCRADYDKVVTAPPETVRELRVETEYAGQRLDQYLASRIPNLSRVRIQQLITDEKVLVNGAGAKASLRLRGGEEIRVLALPKAPGLRAIAENIPLQVVYEDEDVAVINKPAGMMVHAGAGSTESDRNRGTLVNALLHHFNALSQVGGELRPGIVHRLDRATSGLILIAKNDSAHRNLGHQFSKREVKKQYVALVHGWVKQNTGRIGASISRDRIRRTRMTTRRAGGREAITDFIVRERIDSHFGRFSLLDVKIGTGRTHQIRVHLASLGHPVVGDSLYGAPKVLSVFARPPRAVTKVPASPLALSRNFLHAAEIEFVHPRTGKAMHFASALPVELTDFLSRVRQ